jgi:hypothetical protein
MMPAGVVRIDSATNRHKKQILSMNEFDFMGSNVESRIIAQSKSAAVQHPVPGALAG